eukprot:g3188.t1
MHSIRRQRSRTGSFCSSTTSCDDVESPSSESRTAAAGRTGTPPPPAAAADTTLLVSDDIINMVATFATCRDLCSLGQVCRRFSPLPFHEDLWELRALDILPGVAQLRSAMSQLALTSCRELVETFTRIGIPGGVLGFWQAEPPSLSSAARTELLSALLLSHGGGGAPRRHRRRRQQQGGDGNGNNGPSTEELEAKGELLRIGLEAGGFVCESIAPDGVRRRIFTIRVSKTAAGKIKIGFFSQEREFSLTIGGDDDDWVPGDSMAEAKARYTFAVPGNTKRSPLRASGARAFFLEREDGRVCRYVKLTAPLSPSSGGSGSSDMKRSSSTASTTSSTSTSTSRRAGAGVGGVQQSLCGLWCAPYGNHGLEIVQLSTDSSCSPFDREAAAAVAADLAADAAEIANFPPAGGGGDSAGRSSWSRSSISRMTDGTESVCTSAPATDDGDGSESGFGCGSDSDSGDGGDAADESAAAASASSSVDCLRTTSKRKRRRHRTNLHHQQQQAPAAAVCPGGEAGPAGAAAADGDATAAVPSQLFGFKVTGDENVPAGKTSFVIDLGTGFDVDEELRSDSRPVVMFLPSGAVMANLANRRDQISAWHKGRGQINRVPGRWLPEWVDVEFVAYRPGSRCAFSVIFRQPAQAVRVVMDFERAHGCEEGWPQWPAAAAAAAAATASSGASRSA